MGKSAFALGIASNLALHHGIPVAVFTLEMSKLEVAQRLMCSEGRVELQRLRTGRLTQRRLAAPRQGLRRAHKAPIYVDDTRLTTMLEIRGKARRLKAREPELGLIMIDYLQLMTSGSNARTASRRSPRSRARSRCSPATSRCRCSRCRSFHAPSRAAPTNGRCSLIFAKAVQSNRIATW